MYKKDWSRDLIRCRQYIEYTPQMEIYSVARATVSARRVNPAVSITGTGRVIETKRFSEDVYVAVIIAFFFIAVFALVLYWII